MDRKAWWATVHGVAKTEQFTLTTGTLRQPTICSLDSIFQPIYKAQLIAQADFHCKCTQLISSTFT